MNILEHEAKAILAASDIPVPSGTLISRDNAPILSAPIVLKSQVPVGGRGKLGGVVVVREQRDVSDTLTRLRSLEIKGYLPSTILAEELIEIDREFYLSLLIDRDSASIQLVAHPMGGIDVEAHTHSEFYRQALTPGTIDAVAQTVAELFEIPGQAFVLADLIEKLYACFIANDATLIEINPLVLTKSSTLIAGDCKMTLDDAAAFRHDDWNFEHQAPDANFISLHPQGTIATIANGAGLAMATVDAVSAAGYRPANFLDIGGGATREGIVESFQKITEFEKVTAIIINIFGGIVRCDVVAEAIVEAKQQFPHLPNLYIRLSGTRSDEAKVILENNQLTLYPDLVACIKGGAHG